MYYSAYMSKRNVAKNGVNRRLYTVRMRPEYIRTIQSTARRERVSQGLVLERLTELFGHKISFPIKRVFNGKGAA